MKIANIYLYNIEYAHVHVLHTYVTAPYTCVKGIQAVTFWVKELQNGPENIDPAQRTEAVRVKEWYLPSLPPSLPLSLTLTQTHSP